MRNSFIHVSPKRLLYSAAFVSAFMSGGAFPSLQAAEVDAISSMQQSLKVEGVVLDEAGIPIIGASILEKGTTNGVITDIDGKFVLNAASSKSVIVISYIGYKTLEIEAGKGNLGMITLKEDSEMLEEVVVVGYGAQKKETLTGSVAVIGGEIFKDKGTVSNPLQAMQGQVPGLMITRSSAAPGEEGWDISIRGAISMNATEPLLIIDGVPASGVSEMAQLNSADIESINFLKDASAAYLWFKSCRWCNSCNYQRHKFRKGKNRI